MANDMQKPPVRMPEPLSLPQPPVRVAPPKTYSPIEWGCGLAMPFMLMRAAPGIAAGIGCLFYCGLFAFLILIAAACAMKF